MTPSKPSYGTIANPGYSNIAEGQENYLKSNLMKMIDTFKEKINKSHKETRENANR